MNPAQLIENRSVRLIFRDCIKLASHMVQDPVKTSAVRRLIRQQFLKNRDLIDQEEIRNLKLAAARGISNYLIHTVKKEYNIGRPNTTIYEQQEEQDQQQNSERK